MGIPVRSARNPYYGWATTPISNQNVDVASNFTLPYSAHLVPGTAYSTVRASYLLSATYLQAPRATPRSFSSNSLAKGGFASVADLMTAVPRFRPLLATNIVLNNPNSSLFYFQQLNNASKSSAAACNDTPSSASQNLIRFNQNCGSCHLQFQNPQFVPTSDYTYQVQMPLAAGSIGESWNWASDRLRDIIAMNGTDNVPRPMADGVDAFNVNPSSPKLTPNAAALAYRTGPLIRSGHLFAGHKNAAAFLSAGGGRAATAYVAYNDTIDCDNGSTILAEGGAAQFDSIKSLHGAPEQTGLVPHPSTPGVLSMTATERASFAKFLETTVRRGGYTFGAMKVSLGRPMAIGQGAVGGGSGGTSGGAPGGTGGTGGTTSGSCSGPSMCIGLVQNSCMMGASMGCVWTP